MAKRKNELKKICKECGETVNKSELVKGLCKDCREEVVKGVNEMKEEKILCTICGEKMDERIFVVQHDYVCEKCFLEYREELELLESGENVVESETSSDNIQYINSFEEEVDMNELNKEIEEIEKELDNEEMVEMRKELVEKVNNGIKYAILKGKNAQVEQRFISAKQLRAIEKSYKMVTGIEMSDEQMMYIKCCNPVQISNILHTLNVANRTLVMA